MPVAPQSGVDHLVSVAAADRDLAWFGPSATGSKSRFAAVVTRDDFSRCPDFTQHQLPAEHPRGRSAASISRPGSTSGRSARTVTTLRLTSRSSESCDAGQIEFDDELLTSRQASIGITVGAPPSPSPAG